MRTGATPSKRGNDDLHTCGKSPDPIANANSGMLGLNLSGKRWRSIYEKDVMLVHNFRFPGISILFLVW